MYAISNMADIWGAKVHKLATYYGWSNMAGGEPKNSTTLMGLRRNIPTVQNLMEAMAPPLQKEKKNNNERKKNAWNL